jgi:hypothetical protein
MAATVVEPTRRDSGVDVYVNSATYDAILALLSQTSDAVPADIVSVFEHRGSFTVFCDNALA